MGRKNHIIIDISNIDITNINTNYALSDFLNNLANFVQGDVVQGPLIIRRKSGFTGIIITEYAQINAHTYMQFSEVAIDIYSYKAFDAHKIKDFILKDLEIKEAALKMTNVAKIDEENWIECEEPRCVMKATKDWRGRNVCSDHYDWYRDNEVMFTSDDDY